MTKLRVRMLRELLRMRTRALAVTLTVASAVTVYVGMKTGMESLYWTRDALYERLGFADLQLRFIPEDLRNFPPLEGIDGVSEVEKRLVFPGIVRLDRGEPLTAVLTLLPTGAPRLNGFEILEGRTFRASEHDAFVIERSFADYHGLEVGDSLAIEVGEQTYEGEVVGIALSSEYLVATSNPDYFIPQKGSLAVAWGNLARVEDALGFTLLNDLVFAFEPGTDPVAVKRRILTRLEKLNIDEVVTRERQFGSRYITTELAAIAHFLPAMFVLLMALAAVITAINFSRLVAIERREIGVLLAIGYSPEAILRSYVEGALVLGSLGTLLGLAGSFPMRDLFAGLTADSMGMPLVLPLVDARLLATGALWGLIVTLASAALPVLRLLRRPLHEVLQDSARRVERGRWSTRMTFLPTSLRYGIRNLMRQRGRAAATLGSIALALGVAAGYRASARAIDETLMQRFANDRWDLAVDFLYPVYSDELEQLTGLPGVEEASPYARRYAELRSSAGSSDAVLIGMNEVGSMTKPPLVAGRSSYRGREMLVSLGLSDRLGVGVGDSVETEVFGRRHRFEITGITSDVVSDLAWVSLPIVQDMFELNEKVTGVHLRAPTGGEHLAESIVGIDYVAKVFEKDNFLRQIQEVIGVMVRVLDLAAAINIFLAVLFVLTSINLSVLETAGEFATLKAIGYGPGPLGRIVFTEASAQAVCAALLSLPVGVLLSVYLNDRLSESWFDVQNFLVPAEYVRLLLPALVLIPLGAYPGFRYVRKLDVSLALRDRLGQ